MPLSLSSDSWPKAAHILGSFLKCLSLRLGEEFYDLDDVRYLLRYLNLTSIDEAKQILGHFYPLDRFRPKAILSQSLLMLSP